MNDKREGYGKYNFESGECYIGQWLKGEEHRKGTYCYKNGKIKIDGDFVHGNPGGKISYLDEDGNSYFGKIINDKFEGIIFDKNGEIKNNNNIDFNEKKCIIF